MKIAYLKAYEDSLPEGLPCLPEEGLAYLKIAYLKIPEPG